NPDSRTRAASSNSIAPRNHFMIEPFYVVVVLLDLLLGRAQLPFCCAAWAIAGRTCPSAVRRPLSRWGKPISYPEIGNGMEMRKNFCAEIGPWSSILIGEPDR